MNFKALRHSPAVTTIDSLIQLKIKLHDFIMYRTKDFKPVGYGHTRLNTPDLVRSRKLSNRRPPTWMGDRLGIPGAVSFCHFFLFLKAPFLNTVIKAMMPLMRHA